MDRFNRSRHHSGSFSQARDHLPQRQVGENAASFGGSEWNAPQINEGYSAPGPDNDYPGNSQLDSFSYDQSYGPQYFGNQYYESPSYNSQYHSQESYTPSTYDQSCWQSGPSSSRAYAEDPSASHGQGTSLTTRPLSYDTHFSSTQRYNLQLIQESDGYLIFDTQPSRAPATTSRDQEAFGFNPVRRTSQAPITPNSRTRQDPNPFAPVVPAEPTKERRGLIDQDDMVTKAGHLLGQLTWH
ncbi:hypothetical protein ACHAPU_010621 [Fusarium lateritium]